jgi:hypothetical protein
MERRGRANGDVGLECELLDLTDEFLRWGEGAGFKERGDRFYEAGVPGGVGFEVEELRGVSFQVMRIVARSGGGLLGMKR